MSRTLYQTSNIAQWNDGKCPSCGYDVRGGDFCLDNMCWDCAASEDSSLLNKIVDNPYAIDPNFRDVNFLFCREIYPGAYAATERGQLGFVWFFFAGEIWEKDIPGAISQYLNM